MIKDRGSVPRSLPCTPSTWVLSFGMWRPLSSTSHGPGRRPTLQRYLIHRPKPPRSLHVFQTEPPRSLVFRADALGNQLRVDQADPADYFVPSPTTSSPTHLPSGTGTPLLVPGALDATLRRCYPAYNICSLDSSICFLDSSMCSLDSSICSLDATRNSVCTVAAGSTLSPGLPYIRSTRGNRAPQPLRGSFSPLALCRETCTSSRTRAT